MSDNTNKIGAIPHSERAEKSIISILLQYPEMADEAASLTSEHFHLPATRTVFGAIRDLQSKGKPIELVSFKQYLDDNGLFERAGGISSLTDLYTYSSIKNHFSAHLEILSQKLACRMTLAAAEEMIRAVHESPDGSEILDVTSGPISAIHDMLTGTRPARSTRAVILSCVEKFEKRCKGEETAMGMQTSLAEIDGRFRGLHKAETVVISGYPGGGKTTLATQLALDVAADGHNALICSLEMGDESLMERMLAYVSRLAGDAVAAPLAYAKEEYGADGPTNEMLRAFGKGAKAMLSFPFHIEDLVGANVHQIVACIRRAHRKRPLDVVVVDFVQRIRAVPEMKRESREQQLAYSSNLLADLSKELGFCLLLPSQLNKEGASKHAEAINEDADLHLQIIQDRSGQSPTKEHLGLAVVKDRHHGNDGRLLPIILDRPMLRFIPKPLAS